MLKKLILTAGLLTLLFIMLQSSTHIYARSSSALLTPSYQTSDVCSTAPAGFAHCLAIQIKPTNQPGFFTAYKRSMTPDGFGPADLRSAYKLPTSGGKGRIVAIVDAYNQPNAEHDLAVYRAQYGLPSCTTANRCFKKVDQNGGTHYPKNDPSWAQETSLDLDMVSAICPDCHILLVEANDASFTNLGKAVNTAVRLGAVAVSNSYGGTEFSSEGYYDIMYYRHPGIAITVSAGDNGYGAEFPAASGYVTAVGGTSLTHDSSPRGWSEEVWGGTGSGCSAYIAKPSWQKDNPCKKRTIADVAAVADPSTPVAVYDSFAYQGESGWMLFGGTSVSAPIVAGIYALAGNTHHGNYASSLYSTTTKLNDVTNGSNGSCDGTYLCRGGAGYDGPTGLGTPGGLGGF
jgi:subtilase family serine protease